VYLVFQLAFMFSVRVMAFIGSYLLTIEEMLY